jgi:hypothetical protein
MSHHRSTAAMWRTVVDVDVKRGRAETRATLARRGNDAATVFATRSALRSVKSDGQTTSSGFGLTPKGCSSTFNAAAR